MRKNTKVGYNWVFVEIIVLIISLLIIGIWFVKVYSTPKATDGKTQIETYNDAIKSAEDVKKAIEMKNVDLGI